MSSLDGIEIRGHRIPINEAKYMRNGVLAKKQTEAHSMVNQHRRFEIGSRVNG